MGAEGCLGGDVVVWFSWMEYVLGTWMGECMLYSIWRRGVSECRMSDSPVAGPPTE